MVEVMGSSEADVAASVATAVTVASSEAGVVDVEALVEVHQLATALRESREPRYGHTNSAPWRTSSFTDDRRKSRLWNRLLDRSHEEGQTNQLHELALKHCMPTGRELGRDDECTTNGHLSCRWNLSFRLGNGAGWLRLYSS